jgi:hypothetical protein
MPKLTVKGDTMHEKDKQWLRNQMPWVDENQCEAFAERVAIMATDRYFIDENKLKQSAIESMQEAGLL